MRDTNGKEYNLRKIRPYTLARIGIGRMFQDNHIFPKLYYTSTRFSKSDYKVLKNMQISQKSRDHDLQAHITRHTYNSQKKSKHVHSFPNSLNRKQRKKQNHKRKKNKPKTSFLL